jgi:heavy metal efflux system protein
VIEAIVGWAIRHRVSVTAVVVLLSIAAAIFAARNLQFDALPDVTTNQVVVLTRAPGLTPQEVERLVTRQVELALGGLPQLEEQRSISRYGISSVTAVFDDAIDPWLARQQVQERIARLGEALPTGVSAPELAPHTGGLGEVYQLTVSSPQRTEAELLELTRLRLAPILTGVPGVVEVNVWGGRQRTLEVRADPERMARYGITLAQLRDALSEASDAAAGAYVQAGPSQALLRGMAWPRDPSELGAAVLDRVDPSTARPLRVADVADVVEGSLPRIGAATSDGLGETVYVMVQMTRDGNALEVVDGLHERMDDVRKALPTDVTIHIVYDRSRLVLATLRTVGKNLGEGALLVIAVLLAMLGSVRAGLLVALVIPLSMLGAATGMILFAIPGNLMSLGAIDCGLLVDGAVVMVERAFHELGLERAKGQRAPDRTALTRAMQSVARPMFFSVLVIVVVYVPILTLTGVDGKMFRPMAATVVMALLTALLLALVFMPAASSLLLRPQHVSPRPPWLVRVFAAGYRPTLAKTMAHPVWVAALAVVMLGAGVLLFLRSDTAFIPQLDEGDLVIQTTRAPDISLETAVQEASRLERVVLAAAPEVEAVTSRIGSPEVATDIMGLEQADVFVELRPRGAWREGLTKSELIEELSRSIESDAPGADLSFTQPIQMRFNELLGGAVTDVAISIYGEDLARLQRIAHEVLVAVEPVPGAHDVRVLAPPAVTMAEVKPDRLAAAELGLSTRDVLDVVRAIRTGIDVGSTWDGPVRLPIRLHLRSTPSAFTLEDVPVVLGPNRWVPLARVANIEFLPTPSVVNRQDAQRRIVVGFNVREASLGTVVDAAREAVAANVTVPAGFRLHWGGQYQNLVDAYARLSVIVPVALSAILALLVLAFRKLGPALLIFLSVPFAGVGGIVALTIRGMPVTISAAIGFIALSGIAVLNSVVLMSGLLRTQREGAAPIDAARQAALDRMRPVLMTALVAALGFVPMALATGVGAEVQRPLATVVVGGLVTDSILTLLMLPSLYPWLARRMRSSDAPAQPH